MYQFSLAARHSFLVAHFSPRAPLFSPLILTAVLLWCPLVAAEDGKAVKYPPSRKDKVVDTLHGVEVPDPFRWLEDTKSPEVRAWVEQQNALTAEVLGKLPGRERIHQQLEKLLDIGMLGTPTPVKGKVFYLKREGKQNQAILYVREGARGTDRVLLDPNELSKEGTIALDWWFPSRDGKLLAYGLSSDGSEKSVLRVRNVETGKDLEDVIDRTRACSVAWLPDGTGFYYTRYPEAGTVPEGDDNYHRHVYFHTLGADPAKDPLVFGKGRDKTDWPDVRLSPDGRWLVVTASQGWARSEVYFKDRSQAESEFKPLVEKVDAIFEVSVRNDRFYVRTNHEAPRYRLFRVDPLKPARGDWKEIIPQGQDVLDGVAAIGDRLVGLFMHQAASRMKLFDGDGAPVEDVALPTLGTIAGLGGEWDGNEVYYGFQSFTTPTTIYRLDFKTGQSELWGQLNTGLDFSPYEVQQVTYPSKDGTPITMFLAHKKGLQKNSKNPTLLYGYGGFNISLTPMFSATRFLFLEQGGLLAIPNLRGGGEYGEEWHEAGMFGKKQNVFDDFIAAAEWLIQEKYTTPERLVIQGGSNGGLLVGAVLVQRPELFKAVVCQVPLLDMVRFHKFLIAQLWTKEYGDPDKPEDFRWIHAYSPYHHVKAGTAYPAVLLATAESDTRVDPLHARKMAARLQEATSSKEPILLRLETQAGHGAGKPRGKIVEEYTDIFSFIFWQLGMKP